MHFRTVEEILLSISVLSGIVLLLIFLLKKLHQPYLIAYILTGVLIGPHCLRIFNNAEDILMLGELGILLHLFFMGTEIEIPDSRSALLHPIIAQIIKMVLSGMAAIAIGKWMYWSDETIFVLFSILIFNSTGVVSEYLKRTNGLHSVLGKTTLNILLLQDLLFSPILIIFQVVSGHGVNPLRIISAIAACIAAFWFLWMARTRRHIMIPRLSGVEHDHELQIFLGFVICACFALISSTLGLTASFGGFIAGIFISRTTYLEWLEKALRPYQIFFICLFFLSIGLAVDIKFITSNYKSVVFLSLLIILMNSAFSSVAFRMLGYRWSDSFYAGALMSQIGEYSLLIGSIAFQAGLLAEDPYRAILSVCALCILLSTLWITLMRAFIFKRKSFIRTIILKRFGPLKKSS